ncbi:MAG: peptide-methionine (R)-S-oxide reductase MsrB [Acidobacteria bacterium]|nr:peptide-methionine (R)-S-oxide reductase MsrB [Acidobacteriota bacterium]
MSSSKSATNDSSTASRVVTRRVFLVGVGAAAVGATWMWSLGRQPISAEAAAAGAPKMVTIIGFKDDGTRTTKESVARVVKTETEWKQQLSPAAFEVTRRAATERPFTGDLLNVHDKGVFRCICCDNALFDSATKFESGTGWPSFCQPIAKENIIESVDLSLGMTRTAVSCRLCEAHLGHVFDDGPKPTGLRYCMNSVAMRFAKASA